MLRRAGRHEQLFIGLRSQRMAGDPVSIRGRDHALALLRELGRDAWGMVALRHLYTRVAGAASTARVGDRAVLDELAQRLALGQIKASAVALAPVASLAGQGAAVAPQATGAPPQGKPAQKDVVDPVIKPARLAVVAKKFSKGPGGAMKPYTRPKRQHVVLGTSKAFDGTGTLTRSGDSVKLFKSADKDDEIKFDGKDNVFKGAQLGGGVTLFAEGTKASAALDDVKLTLKLTGGSKTIGPDAVATATSVEATLDICKSRPVGGGDPPAFSTDDKINLGRVVLEQTKDGTHERAMLIIRQVKPAAFKGDLVLKARDARVSAFFMEKQTKGERKVEPYTTAADKVPAAGEKLWAEGVSASGEMRDTGFQLGIVGVDDDADRVNMTVAKVALDICKSRSKKDKKGADPAAMSDDDKLKVGRFVHEQDASNHHGRALLVVREVKPKKFDGTLVLKAINPAKTELFPNERPKAGEAAIASPREIDYTKEKNEDKKLWMQGKAVSGAIRDAGYVLFLKDHAETEGDKSVVTVCKFSHLKADIPSTPPVTARAGNAAARHAYEILGTAADHWDVNDAKNKALVLVEGSVLAIDDAHKILLTVQIAPAGVPVSWSRQRDTRPAPDGDHANVAALSGLPTLETDKVDPLKARLQADGVGTFHIRPFVDCNGDNDFDAGVDVEPYLVMNLVVIRVKGKVNASVKGASAVVTPAAPTSATGCAVQSGGPGAAAWTPANAAAYSKATVKVIGGGQDGRRGLDRLFAGWAQHIGPTATSASVPQGLDIFAQYRFQPPPLPPPPFGPPPPPPAPVFHRQFFIFTRTGAMGTVFGPGPPVPVVEACPVLDVSIPRPTLGTGGDSCTGQAGVGPFTSPIPVVNKAIGQEWTIDTLDSPGVGLGAAHPNFPGTMVAFRFNINFRVDLVFWTNATAASTATGDPADRLYSSVQTNNWSVQFAINFNPVTGMPVGAVPPVTLTMAKDPAPTRLAAPVEGLGLEVRSPIALNMFSIDARA